MNWIQIHVHVMRTPVCGVSDVIEVKAAGFFCEWQHLLIHHGYISGNQATVPGVALSLDLNSSTL